MQNTYNILFIGDIVGRPGRKAVEHFLAQQSSQYDFVIANVENASHGFGLTKKNYDELISYGINCMTSGNHIWDKKEILTYIDEQDILIRPYNYHKSAQGRGWNIFSDKFIVINLLGKTFMPPINCPFTALEEALNEISSEHELKDKIIIVDFHAEATAEKQCFAKFASSLGVNTVIGTHTHVQTSDETIIDDKCAYITDVGFCGSQKGVIGMEYDSSLKRLLTSINERFDVENASPYTLNACELRFCNNTINDIKRINYIYDENEVCEDEN